jgi:hypothetical protein
MTFRTVHDMATPWTSTDPALSVTVDPWLLVDREVQASGLRYEGGPAAAVELAPPSPVDLSAFDELRVWMRTDRPAAGTAARPFFLALSFDDTGDGPAEEHRWFLPANEPGRWEQRRIGLEGDRRSAVRRFRFETVSSEPFRVVLSGLLAVREDMLGDLWTALAATLAGLELPGVTRVPLAAGAAPGATQVEVGLNRGFAVGNRVRLAGGSAGDEIRDVTAVGHDDGAGRTTLTLAEAVTATLPAGTATVTVQMVVDDAPGGGAVPRVVVTLLDAREDPARSGVGQRDSFRSRGAVTVCSTRPAARAYLVDHQLTPVGADRGQQLRLLGELVRAFSADCALWVNETPAPVWILPPPVLESRVPGQPAAVYVRIGSRVEVAPRRERPLVRRAEAQAGQIGTDDREGITVLP